MVAPLKRMMSTQYHHSINPHEVHHQEMLDVALFQKISKKVKEAKVRAKGNKLRSYLNEDLELEYKGSK